MQTPFSQTVAGAIFIAVVAGVIVLLIQSNFFGQSGTKQYDPMANDKGVVVYPRNPPIIPEVKYEVACDTLRSPDACTYYVYCKWNPAAYHLSPGDENLGYCTQKAGW
jgi:hypothetical protein